MRGEMTMRAKSTEALNVNAIINQLSLSKTVILEDQYNGRMTYYVPILKNGRIFIAKWNNTSFTLDKFVSINYPQKMKEYEFMVINQLPVNKLGELDRSIITFITDTVTQRLNKYESYYVDNKIYIRPFPV